MSEWMPLRLNIWDDPRVIDFAAALEEPVVVTVGRLARFWGWAFSYSDDGHVRGATGRHVDQLVGRDGFADVLAAQKQLDYLRYDENGEVWLPRFHLWMGASTRKRLQARRRKQKQRMREGGEANVTPMSPPMSRSGVTHPQECAQRAPPDGVAPMSRNRVTGGAQQRDHSTVQDSTGQYSRGQQRERDTKDPSPLDPAYQPFAQRLLEDAGCDEKAVAEFAAAGLLLKDIRAGIAAMPAGVKIPGAWLRKRFRSKGGRV